MLNLQPNSLSPVRFFPHERIRPRKGPAHGYPPAPLVIKPRNGLKPRNTERANMMNKKRLMILGVGASIVGVLAMAQPANAQVREARGSITAVTDNTLSMKAGAEEWTFFVDGETHLEVRRAERDIQKEQPGRPSPRVSNFFQPGQAVLVRFREEKGRNHALDISRVGSAGGGSISDPVNVSDGKVKSVSPSQLIIDDGGRELTFGISRDTDVLVRGATKATKAAGGKSEITTYVHTGDTVSISYHETGAKMMASEVRVKVVNR